MDARTAPIACTLRPDDYRTRLAWIAELTRDGLLESRRQDLRLDLRYSLDVADRVRAMVSKERDCCAFLEFELIETAEDIRLTITAPKRAREAADEVFEPFVPRV